MANWFQLIVHIKTFPLSDAPDVPVWMLEPKESYSVRSFYNAINFGGVVSTIGDSLWKILCPQNIHVFLWLCVYNEVLTRDNLAKRRTVDDPTCLLCNEAESVQHLFSDCVVAKSVWDFVSEFFQTSEISCFADICAFWRQHKSKPVLNMVITASLWSIWRLRNEFCFQCSPWRSLNCVLVKLNGYLHQWAILCNDTQAALLR